MVGLLYRKEQIVIASRCRRFRRRKIQQVGGSDLSIEDAHLQRLQVGNGQFDRNAVEVAVGDRPCE
jgi:hypothetical protein